jgi:hypothetical protein
MVDYETWIYKVGGDPTGSLNFMTTNIQTAVNLANSYVSLGGASSPPGFSVYNSWISNLKVIFHQTLLYNLATNTAVMARIDSDLSVTQTLDPEVRERWYTLGLYLNYNPVFAPT